MGRNYIITSGYCSAGKCPYPWNVDTSRHKLMKGPEFHELWEEIVAKYTNPKAVLIIDSDEKAKIKTNHTLLPMVENFGHQIGKIEGQFCGWTRAWLLGMFYAWINDCDHFFVEQDVLAFGNWTEAIYEHVDKNRLSMTFGSKGFSGSAYEQEVGLTFTRKGFIPEFLKAFMIFESTDKAFGAEHKIAVIRKLFGKRVGFHPFGYGLTKPEREFGKKLPFYGHRWSFQDIRKLVILGLVDDKYIFSKEEGGEEK